MATGMATIPLLSLLSLMLVDVRIFARECVLSEVMPSNTRQIMKKSKDSQLVMFPVPRGGTAMNPEDLPSFPAFPVGRDGNYLRIAVPSLVIIDADAVNADAERCSLADAVEMCRSGAMEIDGVPVGCVPLAPGCLNSRPVLPEVRSRLLGRLFSVIDEWDREMDAGADGRESACAAAGQEIRALLAMFHAAGVMQPTESIS